MKLPRLVMLLGYAGLLPFLVVPLWLTVHAASAPEWLDRVWISYVAMIAAFMAGTFWGFALPACEGPQGLIGLVVSSLLMIAAWTALLLPMHAALLGLVVVFLLQLLVDFWFERTLGSVEGYFHLRAVLTAGACIAVSWRLLL
jgi:hypothetical protein